MGLERRKKSNQLFAGSKLTVPGQGILGVQKPTKQEKISIGQIETRVPRPSQTPLPTPTPTPTPITECLLSQENYFNILTENGNFILVECP